MIYTATVETAHSTLESNPKRTTLKLTKGMIYRVAFYFPPGPSGLVGVRVLHSHYQVWPNKPEEFFYGDNITIEFEDTFLLSAPPFELDIYTWNTDTAYAHTIQVRVGFVSEEIFMARYLPTIGAEKIGEVIAEAMQRQQSTEEQALRSRYNDYVERIGLNHGE